MTRIRSITLLIAFLVGAIQPLIPLMEYYVFKESIVEHLCENRHDPESDCDGRCYLARQIQKNQDRDEQHNLGSTYYPGAVLYGNAAELIRPMDHPTLLMFGSDSLTEFHTVPANPPPESVQKLVGFVSRK